MLVLVSSHTNAQIGVSEVKRFLGPKLFSRLASRYYALYRDMAS